MDNGNAAEVTYIIFKVPYIFKIWQIARQSNSLYSPQLNAFCKFWLNWMKNVGAVFHSSLLKILTSEILQSAPNDAELNSKNWTCKVRRTPAP